MTLCLTSIKKSALPQKLWAVLVYYVEQNEYMLWANLFTFI